MSDKEYIEVIQKMFNYKPTTNFILAGPKTLKQLRRQINEELIKILGNMSNFKKPGVYNQIHEPCIYKYDKIDSEMMKQFIDVILMGNDKKEMVMNKLELEVKRLRERTGDNYMLNKMVNTDGVEFFAEYTLYKDYDKYFGLTLSGTSINIVDIIEEEFAGLLSSYRIQPKDSWHITPEENETIKEQMESGETNKFTPMYDEDDIDKQLVVDSKYDMSINSFSESHLKGPEMWTETSTNTGKGCEESWTETSTNTGENCAEPWTSGTVSVGSGTISVAPEAFYIDEKQLKGLSTTQHLKNIQDGYVLISDIENKSNEEELEDSTNILKSTENKSRAELTTKIISDIIEELLTKGTCSLNISLKQD